MATTGAVSQWTGRAVAARRRTRRRVVARAVGENGCAFLLAARTCNRQWTRARTDERTSLDRPATRAVARTRSTARAPSQRSAFLKDVARRLHNVELGDGAVAQAAREFSPAMDSGLL